MAVVRSVDKRASLSCSEKIINFPTRNKGDKNKDVFDFLSSVDQLKKDYLAKSKSSKKLLKDCNEVIAKTKKTEKAILDGKLNKSVDENICQRFKKAKNILQDIVNSVKR